jgi:hypothetical protein
LIGTNPSSVTPGIEASGGVIPTEFLDAYDVLDWFINPDMFGYLPKEQLFFAADVEATENNVKRAKNEVDISSTSEDSVLFYVSGHATIFSLGELQLYDSPVGSSTALASDPAHLAQGIVKAPELIRWLNGLKARKTVAILDSGGYGVYGACENLRPGRFVLSSINGITLSRSGFITWYLRRALQKLGVTTTLAIIHRVLMQAEAAWIKRGGDPLYVYSRGSLR